MRPTFIIARDIPDMWFQLINETINNGRLYNVTKGSTPTKRLELDFMSGQITHPGTRPLEPDIPHHLNIPSPVDPNYIEQYLSYYMTNDLKPEESYSYGQDMYWQIEWIIRYYKKYGPGTKHCYMTIGRPELLFAYDNDIKCKNYIKVIDKNSKKIINEREISTDLMYESTPCLRGIDTAIKDDKLHFSVHFRSWNLWSGLPANLACIQIIKEYMASEIGVDDGELFISCLKLGLAESCFDVAKKRLYLENEKNV